VAFYSRLHMGFSSRKIAPPDGRLHCRHALTVMMSVAVLMSTCSKDAGGAPVPAAIVSAAPAAVTRPLEVPVALAAAPFDTPKTLDVPPGFGIRLLARVEGARFMAVAPNGDILVSNPDSGDVVLLRERAGNGPESFSFASGLQLPHDMVFHQIGNVVYLYIAESNRVSRSVYTSGDTRTAAREVVVDNLPSADLPELRGVYGHQLKNIALSPDHKLYISIASACNACIEDTVSNPLRGAIYQYNADGSGQRLFARGLRNAEGLDFIPGTNDLWLTVNGRDNLLYPFDNDFDGDGSSDYGKLNQKFVDDNPPELFTRARDGGNYGWPFCNPLPNAPMANLELARDYELNRDGSRLDCAGVDRASKGLHAHSAPLGFSFLQNSQVPAAYRNGAVIALHGCWNCSSLRAGYKVIYIPIDIAGNAGAEIDLVTGFVTNPDTREMWGRPVDVLADSKGNILVSDDLAGAIYQLYSLLP
jgi:glucose/arabinose dehydrogenase